MRAMPRVLQQVDRSLRFLHKQRRRALLRAVGALVVGGGSLWLSALGRAVEGPVLRKHAIKMVDRLLGNRAIQASRVEIYRAVAALLLRGARQAVVLADITQVRPGKYALTASLAMNGRGVPIYSQVRSQGAISKKASIAAFLRALKRVLPEGIEAVLVTDAGFESPWFDQVAEHGWHYVGRVRHLTKFQLDGKWVGVKQLHRRARPWVECLGHLLFPRCRPRSRRIVLAPKPQSKHRFRMTKRRRKGCSQTDARCVSSAREPWVLATSLERPSHVIVEIYALRMQIEQNYRDHKNHRWGWRLDQTRSRSSERLSMLLLIAAIAMCVVLAFGCLAERQHLQRRYQANTLSSRRVLSFFTLGLFVLRDALSPLRAGPSLLFAEIRSRIWQLPMTA